MVAAGGYMELSGTHNIGNIVNELKRRDISINDISDERIMFLIERENIDVVKSEISLLKGMADVKSVHLTYYSVEDR